MRTPLLMHAAKLGSYTSASKFRLHDERAHDALWREWITVPKTVRCCRKPLYQMLSQADAARVAVVRLKAAHTWRAVPRTARLLSPKDREVSAARERFLRTRRARRALQTRAGSARAPLPPPPPWPHAHAHAPSLRARPRAPPPPRHRTASRKYARRAPALQPCSPRPPALVHALGHPPPPPHRSLPASRPRAAWARRPPPSLCGASHVPPSRLRPLSLQSRLTPPPPAPPRRHR